MQKKTIKVTDPKEFVEKMHHLSNLQLKDAVRAAKDLIANLEAGVYMLETVGIETQLEDLHVLSTQMMNKSNALYSKLMGLTANMMLHRNGVIQLLIRPEGGEASNKQDDWTEEDSSDNI